MNFLANNYPNDFYSDDLAKSFDFTGYFDNQRQRQEAFENQRINRQMALENLFQSQQQFPLEQQQRQANIDTSRARLPGIQAESDITGVKARIAKSTEADQLKAEQMKLAAQFSEDQVKDQLNQIQRLRLNANTPPEQRKLLDFLYDQTAEIYKIKKAGEVKQATEIVKAQNRPAPAPRSSGGSKAAPRVPRTHLEAEAFWSHKAATTDDEQEKAYYTQLAASAAEANRRVMQEAATAKLTGKPDIAGAAGLPVNPGLTTQPNPATASRPARQAEAQAPKTLFATNPQTKQRIMSTDGGKTWKPAQ